jgi:hypothetical protein
VSFTGVILRAMLRRRGTAKTVRVVLSAERDRQRRIVALAETLRLDWEGEMQFCGDDARTINGLMACALTRVCWRTIARELLDRFSPKLLAGYVPTPSIN